MKLKDKIFATLAIALFVTLLLLTGSFFVNTAKYMGANMLTIRDVLGCYFLAGLIWGVIFILLLMKSSTKKTKQ